MSPRSPLLKAHRILHLVLVAFLLIGLRVWHLGTIQREEKLKEAQRPKLRTTWLRADRGAIFDRFHIPLAVNKICYNASVYYGQIAQIPTLSWSLDETGQKTKIFPRKEYIKELSFLLSDLLSLEPQRVEDLIHSKASLLPHVPYILKKNLTEEQYYRLKMLEKDWPGLSAEIGSERFYPQGKTACHLLGSLGSIAEKEYRAIVEEIHLLEKAKQEFEAGAFATPLPAHYNSFEAVQRRLYELKEKAYSVNDRIGKSGIEKAFEEQLRGFWGVKTYEVDQKGKVIQELPSSKAPLAGREIVLTISSELQAFAEELLIRSEKERQGRSLGIDPVDHERKIQKQPWIKGGAIVALDPKSGEILAFASHPRHDPNDLAKNRWL